VPWSKDGFNHSKYGFDAEFMGNSWNMKGITTKK
jgi:hypothetical protein